MTQKEFDERNAKGFEGDEYLAADIANICKVKQVIGLVKNNMTQIWAGIKQAFSFSKIKHIVDAGYIDNVFPVFIRLANKMFARHGQCTGVADVRRRAGHPAVCRRPGYMAVVVSSGWVDAPGYRFCLAVCLVCIYDKLENEKVFLLKDNKGKSFGMSLRQMTIAKKWKENTHKNYVKKFLKMGNCEVFVLDSPKELAQWLAE